MWSSNVNEMKASLVASYSYFFFGVNVAFSADIQNLLPNRTITLAEESFIGSINIYVSALSCLLVGYLSNAIGRKKVIWIATLLNVTGWTIMNFLLYNIETVYLSRVFCGMSSGLGAASSLYISETSHKSRRGKLLAFAGLTNSFGVSLTYMIQYFFSSKVVARVAFIIAVISSIQAYFLPETKYYLLMKKDLQKAHDSILWFDHTVTPDEVHREIADIRAQQDINQKTSVFSIFRRLSTLKILLICSLIYVLRCGSARVAITAYPQKFYALFLLPVSVRNMAVVRGANEIIWSILSVLTIDSYPRKFMLQLCCWTLNLCLVIFYFQVPLVQKTGKFGEVVILIGLIMYLGMATGFLVDWSIICVAEAASSNSEYRAIICSFVQFFGGMSGAVYNNVFPLMLAKLSTSAIFISMASSITALSLVVSYVPETLGKALHKCDWQESKHKQNYLLVETSESDISSGDEESLKPER